MIGTILVVGGISVGGYVAYELYKSKKAFTAGNAIAQVEQTVAQVEQTAGNALNQDEQTAVAEVKTDVTKSS